MPNCNGSRKEPSRRSFTKAHSTITIDHDRSVEEMVRAGKYDWSNDDITSKHFLSDRKGTTQVRIQLIHFNRAMESDDVLHELDKQGLRPATLPELLALGEKHPELQRQFPIVALGSVWRRLFGDRRVACLYGHVGGRRLRLNWFDGRWCGDCRFAAVSK
jgi:hypothetical protein